VLKFIKYCHHYTKVSSINSSNIHAEVTLINKTRLINNSIASTDWNHNQ